MKKVIKLLLILLPLIPFAQTATNGKPVIDRAKIDTLWAHTKNAPGRYVIIDKYFSLSGVVRSVGKGVDNDDCDSTFNVTLSPASKMIIDDLIKNNPQIRRSIQTDTIHIEITCAGNNCTQPFCKGFKYPFPQPVVPALNAIITITGSLVIETHDKYLLEMHPVSEIK